MTWRNILARAPLPMLALAASYGVYSFQALFVPHWIALVSATAFELTYVGLALVRIDDAGQRARARAISVGAVAVSVLYNTLAGLVHRSPDVVATLPRAGEAILAVLHGAPLAIVAYLVADLLLHDNARAHADDVRVADDARAHADDARVVDDARARYNERAHDAHDARARALAALATGASVAEVARQLNVNASTVRSWRARAARPASAAD